MELGDMQVRGRRKTHSLRRVEKEDQSEGIQVEVPTSFTSMELIDVEADKEGREPVMPGKSLIFL
jgi:hypothetical protein